jgi:hypothetical protein
MKKQASLPVIIPAGSPHKRNIISPSVELNSPLHKKFFKLASLLVA